MLALAGAVALGVAATLAGPWRTERRRARIRAQPFPKAWRLLLRRHVPQAARLPADLQQRLKGHVMVFLAEKPFIGCQGQPVHDGLRISVAAQACLLLLGQARPDYFPLLRQVLVYPGAFVADRVAHQAGGLQQQQRRALAGESWGQGQVLLSWADVQAGAADPGDGQNLVLHEFAHQIDQDKGTADGRPWRASRAQRRQWDAVMGAAFRRLQTEPSDLFGSYAASDPAEFFAVATERFFEQPQALFDHAPEVYRELSLLYRVHPLVW